MKAKRHVVTAASVVLALTLAGCSLPGQFAEAPGGQELTERKAKAAALARKGNLTAALVEWRVLEALAGGDAEIVRERREVEAEIDRQTSAEFETGRKASAKGRLKRARRSFLTVLKIDPNHKAAIEELRKIEIVRVRQRRPIFTDAVSARLAAAAKPAEVSEPPAATPGAPATPRSDRSPAPQKAALNEAAALAERGAHDRAIVLLETHLKRYREDNEARARLSSLHAAMGIALFKEGKLEQSVPHLEKSAAVEERDPQVARMLADARGQLAQDAYEKGVRVFRQDVARAIAFWEESLAYDPGHTKARFYLEKAYRIQATLKSIKP